ncbi:MAG: hypothetical protein KJ718_05645 [Nanoarchaeota archaeon]|nr:hypothetical protein [Nanoarchaeota archaeon]
MRERRVRTVIYVLLVLLIALSGYLTYSKSIGNEEGVCIIDPTQKNGCSDVQNGPYGSLFGFKLCHGSDISCCFAFGLYSWKHT